MKVVVNKMLIFLSHTMEVIYVILNILHVANRHIIKTLMLLFCLAINLFQKNLFL
jgi:hypothetical protein